MGGCGFLGAGWRGRWMFIYERIVSVFSYGGGLGWKAGRGLGY